MLIRHNSAVLLAIVLLSLAANAQENQRIELFGGYSHLNWFYHLDSPTAIGQTKYDEGLQGWDTSVSVKLSRSWAVEGDIGGQYEPRETLIKFSLSTASRDKVRPA